MVVANVLKLHFQKAIVTSFIFLHTFFPGELVFQALIWKVFIIFKLSYEASKLFIWIIASRIQYNILLAL